MSIGNSIVLMSGGIDSSASAVAVRKEGYETSGLFVDYGQPAACSEWRAVQDVADHFDLEVQKVELGFRLASESGEFFGRNALLVLTAAGITESRPPMIALGIHALSEYYDTQPLLPAANTTDPGRLFRWFRNSNRSVLGLPEGRGDCVCQGQRRALGHDLQL